MNSKYPFPSTAEYPYSIQYYNFGYFSQDTYSTLEEALEAAKKSTFCCKIYENDKLVALYDYFGGVSYRV